MRRARGGAVHTRRTSRRLTPEDLQRAINAINNERRHRHRPLRRGRRAAAAPARPPSPPTPPSPPSLPDSPPTSPDDYQLEDPFARERQIPYDEAIRLMPRADIPQPSDAEDSDDEPPRLGNMAANNFYIFPLEIMRFMENEDGMLANDMVNLRTVQNTFERMKRSREAIQPFISNRERQDHPIDFARNEIRKLLKRPYSISSMFPTLAPDGSMNIPSQDVRDLPVFLLTFILHRLAEDGAKRGTFQVVFTLGSDVRYPIYTSNAHPVYVTNGKISIDDLHAIYSTLIREFAKMLPGDIGEPPDYMITWNGSEDSGTRIRLLNHGDWNLKVNLILIPNHGQRRAGVWTKEIHDFLSTTIADSIVTVQNTKDNKCLLYCIIMGILLKFQPGNPRLFGVGVWLVPDHEVYCKAKWVNAQDDDEASVLLRKLANYLFPPEYSAGTPNDPLIQYVEDIDKKVGTMTTIAGFREEFADIEEKLIPKNVCGIDVYGIDFNINIHVYPLYISKRREKVIELLCVTPKNSVCSHYCVITNKDKLMKQTVGKQFFSCSKCGQCFYHRRLLNDHNCPAAHDPHAVPGEGGYHFSEMGANEYDMEVGVCPKCRLSFISQFRFDYHKEHCLMKGITGYRHVQLVTYEDGEHPTLRGSEINMEDEEKHVADRRMMYADFESTIDPETGEHTMMSYGLYEWEKDEYVTGYNIREFMEYIVETAYSNPQTHIYVYFHNAMGYDANFILRYVLQTEECKNWGIQVIMKSSNRLQKLVFYTHRDEERRVIHICDTFLFLTLSLERIVGSIRKDDVDVNQENFSRFFHVFHRRYPGVSSEEIDHILRKNIFPYKFFTTPEKLEVGIEDFEKIFYPKEENLSYFSERVTLQDLQNNLEDFKHVVAVYGCTSAKDYHDLYLCCDVMQLADVFDRSMTILWESHHIHLTRYLGMPSASWAAFLRHDPRLCIPLYEDTFFAEFFKAMIRGGITSAALRHAVADERHSIIYLDVNGLYPYVMQAYGFPCGQFKLVQLNWEAPECEIKLCELFTQFERENRGMCFCVDLHISDYAKELTDMYPFAPEHRKIYSEYYTDLDKREMTPFLERWSEANDGERMTEFHGLVCTLYDKEKYNVHWRLLRFYMLHGVRVKKVWFGVSFSEGEYLAGYIRKNIAIRNTRKDELGKTLYKLLGNSIYGKTFESPFKRNTYEIVRDPVKLQGLMEEGNIAAMVPIDNLGWIVRMDGEDIVLDKPTYIGACVCEFSKLHMYTLLYDKLMKIFPSVSGDPGCQLVYTDTDSFIVRVRHPDGVGSGPAALFSYIKSQDPDLIGGIGGQVKSETGEDETIQEVIALRSKVYAYVTTGGHIGKRAKGTTHDAQEMQLDWETYKQALESLTSINTKNVQFVRKTFKISSLDVFRRSLSVNDGKRYICEDGIHTHAFGYPTLPQH